MFDLEKKIGVAVLCNTSNYKVCDLAKNIFSIVTEDSSKKTLSRDSNYIINNVCLTIFIICIIFFLIKIYFISKLLRDILIRKKKDLLFKYKNPGKTICKIFILIFVSLLFFLTPSLFFKSNWNFLFVWISYTFKYVVFALTIDAVLLCVNFIGFFALAKFFDSYSKG